MAAPRSGSESDAGQSDGRDPSTCGSCGGESLTQLSLVLTDGTPVTFISCQRCEAREWMTEQEDGTWLVLPIDVVLAKSARKRP